MIEYACIYPKKQSAEYARILNMSNVVHSIRSLYKLQQLSKQAYLEHCQTFKRVFYKKDNAWVQVSNQKHFRAGGVGFVKLGQFNKRFVKNTRKLGPAGNYFGNFCPRYS